MTPADALLILHIAAGFFALFSALVAALSVSLHWPFYWHVLSGTVFVVAMSAVFVTAIPLAFLGGSFFLFLIAIFSFSLAFSGWRLAKNRGGTPTSIDWGSGGLMCLSGLVMIGVGVVFRTTGIGLFDALRSGSRGGSSQRSARLRALLVGSEVALSTALVIGVVLMVKSFVPERTTDYGYDRDNILTAQVTLSGSAYSDARERAAYLERAVQNLRSLPEIELAGAVDDAGGEPQPQRGP